MPSISKRQRRFMGSELARKRAGQKTMTNMSEQQLREFASGKLAKKSTRGSPAFTGEELMQGYRRV